MLCIVIQIKEHVLIDSRSHSAKNGSETTECKWKVSVVLAVAGASGMTTDNL